MNHYHIKSCLMYTFMAGLISTPLLQAHAAEPVRLKTAQIDTSFINKMEGVKLNAYVPLPGKSKSGVTIGRGIDLGQMHAREFNSLPINQMLKSKLFPYVGLTRFQAVAFLKTHPLTISHQEMDELNNVFLNRHLIPLIKAYNKSSKVAFTEIPPQAQTALFSFAYQYGNGFMKKGTGKLLWKSYVTQDWPQVCRILSSDKRYAPRRRAEAKLVGSIK